MKTLTRLVVAALAFGAAGACTAPADELEGRPGGGAASSGASSGEAASSGGAGASSSGGGASSGGASSGGASSGGASSGGASSSGSSTSSSGAAAITPHAPNATSRPCSAAETPGGCFSEYDLKKPSDAANLVGRFYSRAKIDATGGVAFNTYQEYGGALTIELTLRADGTWASRGFRGYQYAKELCPTAKLPEEKGRYTAAHDAAYNVERVTFQRDDSNGRTNLPPVTLSVHAPAGGPLVVMGTDAAPPGLGSKPPYFFGGLPLGDNREMHLLFPGQTAWYYRPHNGPTPIDPCGT
jgi:hypothetical protein